MINAHNSNIYGGSFFFSVPRRICFGPGSQKTFQQPHTKHQGKKSKKKGHKDDKKYDACMSGDDVKDKICMSGGDVKDNICMSGGDVKDNMCMSGGDVKDNMCMSGGGAMNVKDLKMAIDSDL